MPTAEVFRKLKFKSILPLQEKLTNFFALLDAMTLNNLHPKE